MQQSHLFQQVAKHPEIILRSRTKPDVSCPAITVLPVLPGTLSQAALVSRMRVADALVIMKLGRNFAKVRRALTEAGLADRAIYVERASMAGEVILPLAAKTDDSAPYFAMILVPGQGRCL